MFKAPTLALLAALIAPSLRAADSLSLDQVLAAVRQRNPELAAAASGLDQARQMALAKHAWMPPRVELELMGLAWPGPDLGAPMQRRWGLSQDLPFPGRTWLQGRAASRMADVRAVEAERVLRERLDEAREAYAELAAAERLRAGLQRVHEATAEMSAASARRASFGQLDRMGQFMDTMLAMEDADVQSMLPMAEQRRTMAEAKLQRLMGADPLKALGPASLDLQALADEPLPSLEEILAHSEQHAPGLALARAERVAAEAAKDSAVAGWLPDVMLSGSVDEDLSTGARGSSAMLGLSLPWLWAWGQAGEHGAANAGLAKARHEEEAARLMLREDLRGHWGDLKAGTEALRITLQKTLPKAERGLALARSGFKTTALGSSEILMAVQDYRMVEEKLASLTVQVAAARSHLLHQAAPLGAHSIGGKP